MIKSILIMAIAAVLVLSSVTMGNLAYALIAHELTHVKVKGTVNCLTATGGDCGIAKAKTQIRLNALEFTQESSSGVGKVKTVLKFNAGNAANTGDFRSKSLTYDYDHFGNRAIIQGPVKASDGSIWHFEMLVEQIDVVKKKAICSSETTSSDGDVLSGPPVDCRVVLSPIES